MTKTVGRKPKFSVEEVRKVILMFRENVQPMGELVIQIFTAMRMNCSRKESY